MKSNAIHITPAERRLEEALGGGYLDDVAWRWLLRLGSRPRDQGQVGASAAIAAATCDNVGESRVR
jgi:hypothetical protein